MFGDPAPSKRELLQEIRWLKTDVARHEREIEMCKWTVREQSEIIQALHTEMGYSLERVDAHWELVEIEDDDE